MASQVIMLCVVWFLMIVMIVSIVLFSILAQSHYTNHLLAPNERYMMDGREYVVPNTPVVGPAYRLKDWFARDLRETIIKTRDTLDSLGIESWLTGGNLISIEFWKGYLFMPYDDDADCAVSFKYRNVLFSQKFVEAANKHGLDVYYTRSSSVRYAERTGACVRVQIKGKIPCMDIFFWKDEPSMRKVVKLDGWNKDGSVVFNKKEQFDHDAVYPIHRKKIDGVEVGVVNNPRSCLIQQYSKGVFEKVIARSTFVAHFAAHVALSRWRIFRKNQAPS